MIRAPSVSMAAEQTRFATTKLADQISHNRGLEKVMYVRLNPVAKRIRGSIRNGRTKIPAGSALQFLHAAMDVTRCECRWSPPWYDNLCTKQANL